MYKTIDSVRKQMNALYATGKAYKAALPFDVMRMIEVRKAVLELAGACSGQSVLDLGCGEGGVAAYWPEPELVTGIDISTTAVKLARKAYPTAKFVSGAIENMKLKKGFQVATAVEVIEHLVDHHKALDQIRAHVDTGSRLIVTSPNRDSLHCRMGAKLGIEVPTCSKDHIHEFGYRELIDTVCKHGFVHEEARGVGLCPYWALESKLGKHMRELTNNDKEVNRWLNQIGAAVPEFAFIQCHRFVAV
jgi:2-polyprenyl-3-methyl-5-hydroxy-6-metoxy-1,4-benzoquinol methylase